MMRTSQNPTELLDPDFWLKLSPDVLYAVYGKDDCNLDLDRAVDVYRPSDDIPSYLLCRTSDRTKRLEAGTEAVPVPCKGPNASFFEVTGSGVVIGIMVQINQAGFQFAHVTPDGAHLVGREPFQSAPIVKDVFSHKTFRSFAIGPTEDRIESGAHDLMVTAKTRWFRKRNNPKFLGFSKENKA